MRSLRGGNLCRLQATAAARPVAPRVRRASEGEQKRRRGEGVPGRSAAPPIDDALARDLIPDARGFLAGLKRSKRLSRGCVASTKERADYFGTDGRCAIPPRFPRGCGIPAAAGHAGRSVIQRVSDRARVRIPATGTTTRPRSGLEMRRIVTRAESSDRFARGLSQRRTAAIVRVVGNEARASATATPRAPYNRVSSRRIRPVRPVPHPSSS